MRISAASATPGGRNVRARRKREGRVDARGARRRAVCVMVCISCTAGVQRFIRHPPRGGDGGAGHLRRRFVGAFCRRSSPRNSHPRVVGECYRDKERIMTRRTVPRAPRALFGGFLRLALVQPRVALAGSPFGRISSRGFAGTPPPKFRVAADSMGVGTGACASSNHDSTGKVQQVARCAERRLQTKRRGRRSVAVHAGEHHEQHGAIVVGDHGAIAEVRLEVLGVGRRGVFLRFFFPSGALSPAAAPFGRFALSPASICAGRLRGGGGGGTWPGGQPREAAASRAYTSPRTRCTGSSDPADRYATAVSFAFGSWRTAFRRTGRARRPPEAGRRRSPRRARGG